MIGKGDVTLTCDDYELSTPNLLSSTKPEEIRCLIFSMKFHHRSNLMRHLHVKDDESKSYALFDKAAAYSVESTELDSPVIGK